jgi:transposase
MPSVVGGAERGGDAAENAIGGVVPGHRTTNYKKWEKSGVWQRVVDALRVQARKQAGREETPSACVMDSQSAKTTQVGGEGRGYDGGKEVKAASGTSPWIRWACCWR